MNSTKPASHQHTLITSEMSRLYAGVCNQIYIELDRQHLSVADLAVKLGWPEDSLQRFLDGDSPPPTLYTLATFEVALGKNFDVRIHQ